jgi:hypothetical protein
MTSTPQPPKLVLSFAAIDAQLLYAAPSHLLVCTISDWQDALPGCGGGERGAVRGGAG